jgi:hypothetical protein
MSRYCDCPDQAQVAALAAGFGQLDQAFASIDHSLSHLEAEPAAELAGIERPQLERDADWVAPCCCGGAPQAKGDSFHGFRFYHSAGGHVVQGPVRDSEEEALEAWNALMEGTR